MLPEECFPLQNAAARRLFQAIGSMGLGAERPSWPRGHAWGLGAEGLRAPNPASPRRRTRGDWVSGTGDPQQSSRAQGAGAAQPRFALWGVGAGGENGLRCFLDPRRVGAVVCCLRSVSLCRIQLPEDCVRPSVRWGLGAERPSWPRGHGWGLGAEGLRAPNPASPRRRTRGEWVSGTRQPQQSRRAQGAGAAQPCFALRRAGARGKTACVAFSIRGALGLWFAARGEFPFAECS